MHSKRGPRGPKDLNPRYGGSICDNCHCGVWLGFPASSSQLPRPHLPQKVIKMTGETPEVRSNKRRTAATAAGTVALATAAAKAAASSKEIPKEFQKKIKKVQKSSKKFQQVP